MGDNGKEEVKQEQPQSAQDFVLTLRLKSDGNIEVNGALQNEMACLYLLEKARDLVKGYNIQAKINQQKILTPKHNFRDFIRKH